MKKMAFIIFTLPLLIFTACESGKESKPIIPENAVVEKIQSGFSFTEGPSANAQGDVYFTDQPDNSIYKWDAVTGNVTLFSDSTERANGTYFAGNGNLLACGDLYGRIISIDTGDGSYNIILDNYEGKQFNGPNDLWVTPGGGIYFTDPYYQRPYWERTEPEMEERVYYLSPDDSLMIAEEEIEKPNGIIGTPDGKYLYIADIGAGNTYRYEINDDGSLKNKTLFAPEGSDGMTIDNEGNIYLINETVSVYNPDGKKIENIQVPERPSNVTFGGMDKDILFITARTSVYKVKMNVKGG